MYKKGKISKSRLGTSNRRIRKEERRVEKKGNGILHKGRERKGDSTNQSEKGWTHLDRATTGDRIWKEINMFSRTNRFTPSMTAHQGNNGQSRQRQDECCCLRDPSRGILHCAQRTPLTLDREGMTMGSQTVRRRTQPLYTREQVERVEQHLAVERVLERLRVLHRLEWNRNLKQNSINWL